MAAWGKMYLDLILAVIVNNFFLIFNLVKYLFPGPFEKVTRERDAMKLRTIYLFVRMHPL